MSGQKETINERVASLGFDTTKLMARRGTLISLLRSLQKSLEQNDTMTDGPKAIVEETAHAQQAGIKSMVRKPTSTLSHRGVQLSEELHAKFNRSGEEGGMSFRDFRGYLAAVGRPKELPHITDNEESWRLFFDDLSGIDERGRMTKEGMVRYRELIEDKHGLEMDLLKLKRKLLPRDIQDWGANKLCFDRVDAEGVAEENKKLARRLGKKKAEKELKWGASGRATVKTFQQLMSDCGEYYTAEQLENMLYVHHCFNALMGQLRAR